MVRLGLVIADSGADDRIAGVSAPPNVIAVAVFETIALIAFAATGALVASRRPRNAIGWLLCAAPFWLAVGFVCEQLAWHSLVGAGSLSGFAQLAFWVSDWFWIPTVLPLFVFIPLLFPSGKPLSRRWGTVGWAALGGGCALLVGSALSPGTLESHRAVENPVGVGGVLGQIADALVFIGFLVAVACTLASAASLAARFRRSHGVERQQLKWVWAAAALLVLSFVVSALLEDLAGEKASWVVLLSGLLAIPVAVAMAILRYRLYDIDVVVNRTLVYGSLTALLAVTYLGSVLLLQLLLSPLTEESNLAVAGSTLAVAALFVPARRRIQRAVDRRFYRRKYDAARALEAFAARLRDEVDLDSLRTELQAVLRDTMQPAHVSLWLRQPGS